MLNLTEEEYGMLKSVPAWDKFIEQLSRDIHQDSLDMANGSLLSTKMEETAINYATNVGRISALIDIVNFRPLREEDVLDAEKLEEGLM